MNIERPRRAEHTYVQSLSAPPSVVFPLLCPVREADWVPDWDPRLVLSESGAAEEECIFITPGEPAESVWVVTHHDARSHRLTMYKVTPGSTVARLRISLAADGEERTHATISYQYTALGPAGEEFLDEFTDEWYLEFMRRWETALEHYLETGEKLA